MRSYFLFFLQHPLHGNLCCPRFTWQPGGSKMQQQQQQQQKPSPQCHGQPLLGTLHGFRNGTPQYTCQSAHHIKANGPLILPNIGQSGSCRCRIYGSALTVSAMLVNSSSSFCFVPVSHGYCQVASHSICQQQKSEYLLSCWIVSTAMNFSALVAWPGLPAAWACLDAIESMVSVSLDSIGSICSSSSFCISMCWTSSWKAPAHRWSCAPDQRDAIARPGSFCWSHSPKHVAQQRVTATALPAQSPPPPPPPPPLPSF